MFPTRLGIHTKGERVSSKFKQVLSILELCVKNAKNSVRLESLSRRCESELSGFNEIEKRQCFLRYGDIYLQTYAVVWSEYTLQLFNDEGINERVHPLQRTIANWISRLMCRKTDLEPPHTRVVSAFQPPVHQTGTEHPPSPRCLSWVKRCPYLKRLLESLEGRGLTV